jgi:hypothetical protein
MAVLAQPVLGEHAEQVALGPGAERQREPLALESLDVAGLQPELRPGDDGLIVGVLGPVRIAVEVADQDQRQPVRDAGQERDRAHDVHFLGAVDQAVDHLDPGRVHDDLGVEAVAGEDALLDAGEDRGVVGRPGGSDPDLERLGGRGPRAAGERDRGHQDENPMHVALLYASQLSSIRSCQR